MSYTVVWRPKAEERLADLWTSATDRNAITAAADAIDAALQLNPLTQGESRAGKTRILIIPPLAVYYQVDPSHRTVSVVRVWRWSASPP